MKLLGCVDLYSDGANTIVWTGPGFYARTDVSDGTYIWVRVGSWPGTDVAAYLHEPELPESITLTIWESEDPDPA